MGTLQCESPVPEPRSRTSSFDRRLSRVSVVGGHKEIRVAVIGPRNVGKSALCVRYLTRRFIGEYGSSETTTTRMVSADGKPVLLHLMDTSTQSNVKEIYTNWADGVLIVFSITDYKTYQEAQDTAREILTSATTDMPVTILLGNKSDLRHLRQVSSSQAAALAGTFCCQYVETSASDSVDSVDNAFGLLLKEVLHKFKNGEKKNSATHQRLMKVKQTLRNLTDFRGRTNTL